VLPREARLQLWREHLGRAEGDDSDLLDPDSAFAAWRSAAAALDAWHDHERRGERPPGRVRAHRPEHVPRWHRWWSHAFHRAFVDPDGRPRHLRRTDDL
jgi:hypothetical protein